jgi:hypothetical protein
MGNTDVRPHIHLGIRQRFYKDQSEGVYTERGDNKATCYDEIPAEFCKIIPIMRDGVETLTNVFNKFKNWKEFPLI